MYVSIYPHIYIYIYVCIYIYIYVYIYTHYIRSHENNYFHDCIYITYLKKNIERSYHAFSDFLISCIFSISKQK